MLVPGVCALRPQEGFKLACLRFLGRGQGSSDLWLAGNEGIERKWGIKGNMHCKLEARVIQEDIGACTPLFGVM